MLHDLPLVHPTPPEWAKFVAAHLDEFLTDHAACERKAAALCMSFITKFPDRSAIVEPMVALAREELAHFQEVHRILVQRQLCLAPRDERDIYVNGILRDLRHGRDERFLDRLITSGLIEARGCERFELLAAQLPDPELQAFYYRLAHSERGHCKVFFRLAELYFPEAEVSAAIERIAGFESQAMLASPISARLH